MKVASSFYLSVLMGTVLALTPLSRPIGALRRLVAAILAIDGRDAPTAAPRQPTALSAIQPANSPKSKSEAEKTVLMGDLRKESGLPPKAFEPDPKLESALERLLQGIRQSRG
jgi:hypothetical protein